MDGYVRLLLLPIAIASGMCCAEAQAVVMSYNIRLDVESDGIHAWANRKSELATFVSSKDPDIIGIQEALPNQVAFLKSSLKFHEVYSQGRDGLEGGEACSIFYRRSKYVLDTAGTFWLSPTPDTPSFGWESCCRRICSWVKLRLQSTSSSSVDSSFYVFNLHLDHEYEAARFHGLSVVLDHIKMLNVDECPVLLIGDFNAPPEARELNQLSESFVDAFEIGKLQSSSSNTGTFSGFTKADNEFKDRIDYIWFSRKHAPRNARYAAMTKTNDHGYISDHLAVVVSW